MKESSYISENPFYMLYESLEIDLSLLVDQLQLSVESTSASSYLEDFLLYSIKYDESKQILHTLLPFYFSHFSTSVEFVKRLLEGENTLSMKRGVIAPILSSCLTATSTELVNCLLYSIVLIIESQGDVNSACQFVEHSLKMSEFSVDSHSVLICCSFFNGKELTPIQVLSCSSLLSCVVTQWIQQRRDLNREVLILALLFASIGNQESILHTVVQALLTTEASYKDWNQAFCREEAILSSFCRMHEYTHFGNSFLLYSLLFSSNKSEFDFCCQSLASIQDPYSVKFTLFL